MPSVRDRRRVTGMLTLRPAEAAWEGMPEIPPPMGALWLTAAEEWVVVVCVGDIVIDGAAAAAVGGAGSGVVDGTANDELAGVGVLAVVAAGRGESEGDDVGADGVDLGGLCWCDDCGPDRRRERERLRG